MLQLGFGGYWILVLVFSWEILIVFGCGFSAVFKIFGIDVRF